MSKEFFQNGPTGSETVIYKAFRGYWVCPDRDAGFGMQIPSDLQSIDEDADQHATSWTIWRSRAVGKLYALSYEPSQLCWHGFRLGSKNPVKARLELAELFNR